MHTTPSPSRRDLLRQASADSHARIDALLSGGFASRDIYGQYLRGMQRFMRESEAALGCDADAGAVARARACLDADLRQLDLAPLPVDEIVPLYALPDILGWQYVVAGSSLGARFLLRDARTLGLDAASGASFLAHHAAGRDWTTFLTRLEAAPLSPQDLPRMGAVARHAFAAAHAAMVAAREEQTA